MLTTQILRKIVNEEMRRIRERNFGKMRDLSSVSAEEVDADGFADTLEKHVDYVKALKMEESRLLRRLRAVQEQRRRISAIR